MPTPMQLIVGLANPGKKYADTRHNAGAWFVEAIANAAKATFRAEKKFHGLYTTATLHDQSFHLLIPTTYMNESGRSVQACVNYLKIEPSAVLIVHDDLDLPAGTVKLKFDGGDGGHNGLKDIMSQLNTKQFYRLRIGIGRPLRGHDVIDYVLNNPSKAERKKIDTALVAAQDILPLILSGQIPQAMQALHTNNGE